ncbi:LysR family transcriptional regulator [Fulvivirga lutimaris]|uniref:LysR family transcriptional regulator n=1 Tax=Fulvivirga lutimaris TaxID=1819566 RepID=UPI0012BBD820|nr:LysR family transcriptional regulator [Fulvivirga lutimaris]MTI38111.1 LysR family transcriptional regulator [Fulvivirga lutimaris]
MHYTLHQLKVFVKVCQYKSITKAADELHLTQPAVSIQLKKLQDQFDIPLTEVIGRQLYVTEFGEQILNLSETLLEGAERINDTANLYKGLFTGKIKIASVSTGKYVIPYFLTGFTREHPNIDLTIDVTNKNLVVESLARNETDFALVSVLPDLSLERIELMDNVLHLVSGSEYYQHSHSMTLKKLTEIPLIFREQGSATRKAMENYLNINKIIPNRSFELTSNEAVKQAVMAGLGMSIMPLIGLRHALQLDKLKIVPLKGLPIKTNWNLVWTSGKNLTPACQALIEYIKSHKEEVIQTNFM